MNGGIGSRLLKDSLHLRFASGPVKKEGGHTKMATQSKNLLTSTNNVDKDFILIFRIRQEIGVGECDTVSCPMFPISSRTNPYSAKNYRPENL
jgi:hypothetical protein